MIENETQVVIFDTKDNIDIDLCLNNHKQIDVFRYYIDFKHKDSKLDQYLRKLKGTDGRSTQLNYINGIPKNEYSVYGLIKPTVTFEDYAILESAFNDVYLYAKGETLSEYQTYVSRYKLPTNDFKTQTKVYIASSYGNKLGASLLANYLEHSNIKVTSQWLKTPSAGYEEETADNYYTNPNTSFQRLRYRATTDFGDIDSAHALVFMYPYGYGTSSEIGYALAQNKPIIIFVDDSHIDDMPLPVGLALTRDPLCIVNTREKLLAKIKEIKQCTQN